MSPFYPHEVADRGSEPQLRVGSKVNYLISRFEGKTELDVPNNYMHPLYSGQKLDTYYL